VVVFPGVTMRLSALLPVVVMAGEGSEPIVGLGELDLCSSWSSANSSLLPIPEAAHEQAMSASADIADRHDGR